MKRWIALLMCLCLLGNVSGGLAEAVRIDLMPPEPASADDATKADDAVEADHDLPDNWDEFFRSMEGRISFSLPSVPDVYPEADLTDDGLASIGWTDKIQLYTNTGSGAEYMVHIANLAPSIRKLRWEYPGQDEFNYRMNAMLSMAAFYLDLYDGSILGDPEATMVQVENEEFPELRFSFTYPDSTGIAYKARGLMDSTRAVLIMAEVDEDSLRLLEDMHIATQAETDAFYSRPPVTVAMGDMRITFPVPPDGILTDEQSEFYDVFTPGYAYLTAEYMSFPVWTLIEDPEHPDEELEAYARLFGEEMVEEGALESCAVDQVAGGIWRFDGLAPLEEYYDGPQERVQCYVTLEGVYSIHSVATDEGQAFLDSITFVIEEE